MQTIRDEHIEIGRKLIIACERDLDRKLTTGERRDLCMDNTDWSYSECEAVVCALRHS